MYLLLIAGFIYGFEKVIPFKLKHLNAETRFSVIIPFRNEAKNLPQLLESIQSLKYPKHLFEVIFVNDFSEDDSVHIISSNLSNKPSNSIDFSIINNISKTKAQKKQVKVEQKKVEEKLRTVEKEVIVEVIKVREQKKTEAKKVAKQKADYVFKINDKVRIIDSNACGTIDKIEKNNAFINYGIFTTKTTLNKLELVESAKK